MLFNKVFRGVSILIISLFVLVSCSTDDDPLLEKEVEQENPVEEEDEDDGVEEEDSTKDIVWPLNTPKLSVDGRYLKNSCGEEVLLHGVAMTPNPWFNGGHVGEWRWNNYDVQGALNYNKSVMDKLTNKDDDGWYLNMVRLHIDPYWSNNPGAEVDGENDISEFNFERFVKGVNEVILPLIEHAKSRGMYVIIRPPGVCPERIDVDDEYHEYLKIVWDYLSQLEELKNSEHVMFELANEPIQILGTNGEWGSNTQPHFDKLKLFFQPLVDMIRNNGFENVIWIPGSGYQSHFKGYANNPIEGDNIGYAIHIYPGYWGEDNNDPVTFRSNWVENIKPVADIAPVAITEIDWAPVGYTAWGQGGVTGEPGAWGFGANFKALADESGNVSWNLLAPENLIDRGDPEGGIAYDNNPEACANAVHKWFGEYAEEKKNCENYE